MENSSNQRKKSSPLLWLILAVVVVGLGAYGIYVYTSEKTNGNTNTVVNANSSANTNANTSINTNLNITIDEETGWKVYKNDKYSYQVSYNPDWIIGEEIITDNEENVYDFVYLANNEDNLKKMSDQQNASLPTTGFKAAISVDKGLGTDADLKIALKTEFGRDAIPLVSENYLTINSLPAYRAYRQLKRGATDSFGDLIEKTSTALEYTYLYNKDLYRFNFTIYGENPEEWIGQLDTVAKGFKIAGI
ncbi:MAG: hypothetical protein WC528_04515 [Patescibacteria group bacterium]